jgi:hypothetical protein
MYVPVNYPILLPSPVNTPPPTRIGMASEAPNLPAQRSAKYKDVLVPRRLSHDPLIPLSFNSTKKWLRSPKHTNFVGIPYVTIISASMLGIYCA